jgi:hypothetical protein
MKPLPNHESNPETKNVSSVSLQISTLHLEHALSLLSGAENAQHHVSTTKALLDGAG